MSPDAGNEFYGLINEKYDILVLSQGVQTQGFTATENKTAAQVALDTAFGEVNSTNAQAWFTEHQN